MEKWEVNREKWWVNVNGIFLHGFLIGYGTIWTGWWFQGQQKRFLACDSLSFETSEGVSTVQSIVKHFCKLLEQNYDLYIHQNSYVQTTYCIFSERSYALDLDQDNLGENLWLRDWTAAVPGQCRAHVTTILFLHVHRVASGVFAAVSLGLSAKRMLWRWPPRFESRRMCYTLPIHSSACYDSQETHALQGVTTQPPVPIQ